MGVCYKRLARHVGIWRVDGIGTITNNGRLGTRAVVHFSGLADTGLSAPYKSNSLNGKVLPFPIHSASICDFIVGSVWKDGKRVSMKNSVEELTIDLMKQKATPLNYSVDLGEAGWVDTILPENYFRLEGNRKDLSTTSYVHVPVINNKNIQRIIVPASELLRFYAGITSPLLSCVLQGELHEYIDLAKSHILNGCVTLHAKRNITKNEAFVLARIVASSSVKNTFLGVHQHLATTNSNNIILRTSEKAPLLIKMLFPFDVQTTLKVSGKKIKISKPSQIPEVWAFFAMEIHSCSHPIGFSRILIEGAEYATSKKRGKTSHSQAPRFNPLINDEINNDFELENYPADRRLRRQVVQHYEDRFPELDAVTITHTKPKEPSSESANQLIVNVPVKAHTMENGSSSKDAEGNIGVDIHDIKSPDVSRDLSLFINMLKSLRKNTNALGWSIATRSLNSGFVKDGECIALFPSSAGRCRTWHKIEQPNGRVRSRQVIVTEVSVGKGNIYFYLLEMELKSDETGQCTILLHNNSFSKMEDKIFNKILCLTAIQNSWLSSNDNWKRNDDRILAGEIFSTVAMYRISHPKVYKTSNENQHDEQSKQVPKTIRTIDPFLWGSYILKKVYSQRSLRRVIMSE